MEVARQTIRFAATSPADPAAPRDRALADNLRWVLSKEEGRGAVVLFAHNAHVQKAPIDIPGVTSGAVTGMGALLHQALGDAYAAIGTTFDRGEDGAPAEADTLDGLLASAGRSPVLLDLRAAETPHVRAWLEGTHPMRFQTMYLRVAPVAAFDGVLFVNRVGPGRRTQ